MSLERLAFGFVACVATVFVAACGDRGAPTPSSATVSATPPPPRPDWLGIELPVGEVEKALNPKNQPAYSGKTGTLRGRVTIKGDPPPEKTFEFPPECGEGAAVYGKLFRVGQEQALGDALVTVTEFEGFVPPTKPAVDVTIQRCAFNQRTYALSFGQRLDVRNLDGKTSYMPYLDGEKNRAYRVAMPQGNTLELHANNPKAHYLLRDQMKRPFLLADVFVLSFTTFDVTGLDGRFEIKGIPIGKVKVNALLPVIAKSTGREVEIVEGDNTLDLELTYDAKVDKAVTVPPPVFGDRNVPAPEVKP